MSSAQPLTCAVQMCLLCTDDLAGCSPEAGTLGDGTPRGPGSPLALCGSGQAAGLPMTHFREEGLSPDTRRTEGWMEGCGTVLTWLLSLNVPI